MLKSLVGDIAVDPNRAKFAVTNFYLETFTYRFNQARVCVPNVDSTKTEYV